MAGRCPPCRDPPSWTSRAEEVIYLSYSCKIFLRSESNGVGRAAEHYAIACKTPGEASERPNQPDRPLTAGTRLRIAVHQSRAVVARLQSARAVTGRQSPSSAPEADAPPSDPRP